MKNYTHFFVSVLIMLLYGCYDTGHLPVTIKQKAINITNRLDSSSVNIFYEWNLEPRGKVKIWYRKSQDTAWCNFVYISFPDTLRLTIYGNLQTFLKDYPLNFPIPSNCSAISFSKSTDNNIRIIANDNKGVRIIIKNRINRRDVFKEANPVEKIISLSKLTDNLSVIKN